VFGQSTSFAAPRRHSRTPGALRAALLAPRLLYVHVLLAGALVNMPRALVDHLADLLCYAA